MQHSVLVRVLAVLTVLGLHLVALDTRYCCSGTSLENINLLDAVRNLPVAGMSPFHRQLTRSFVTFRIAEMLQIAQRSS